MNTTQSSPLDVIRSFIESERDRFEIEHNNMFAIALGEVTRYYRYLLVISERQQAYGTRLRAKADELHKSLLPGNRRMTAAQVETMHERDHLSMLLQLEMESFFLFAKILLDKGARAVLFYFGQANRFHLQSHDDLTKELRGFAEAKGLELAESFTPLLERLRTNVADYRDKQIAHANSPRTVRGMGFSGDGSMQVIASRIFPKESDVSVTSASPGEVMADIDDYIQHLIELLATNRQRTALRITVEGKSALD